MTTTMGFAQVGFLVLLCLSFCSARRVLTETTDVEKPKFARSFQATQSTSGLKSGGGISSLDDSKWQSGGKGSHCSGGGGGGGGGGGACCGGNEGCGGCGNFGGGGGGGYCGGCGNFGGGGSGGGGYCGGNGGYGCGYACGSGGGGGGGGNFEGGCYCPQPPTCSPVSCPPVSNCCPVGCPPGYGHPKVAAQHWANSQAPPRPQITLTSKNDNVQPGYGQPDVTAHHWANSKVPTSPKVIFNAENDSKPIHSDKEKQLEQKTEMDSKNEPAPPGLDGQMQEDDSKN